MKSILLILIVLAAGCADSPDSDTDESHTVTMNLVDSLDPLSAVAAGIVDDIECDQFVVDSSLSGLTLRDPLSFEQKLGKLTLDSLGRYHVYSADGTQMLTLTQHPGDLEYEINEFMVSLKEGQTFSEIRGSGFTSGRGVKLGITKEELIALLGNCYALVNPEHSEYQVVYRVAVPRDTENNFLARHNMPVYFGHYDFSDGVLRSFSFGFEYP